ncbi:nuclear transport factor 2 family protein [Microbispora sp. KK1-11]|nr:nuclear transport factor 2 family protein [Microbispora sp. KK1-11]
MAQQRSEWSDQQEIHEVVLRYCRGVDRLDMDLVRSAYHPDAIDA